MISASVPVLASIKYGHNEAETNLSLLRHFWFMVYHRDKTKVMQHEVVQS